jgi:hypothetical protein
VGFVYGGTGLRMTELWSGDMPIGEDLRVSLRSGNVFLKLLSGD